MHNIYYGHTDVFPTPRVGRPELHSLLKLQHFERILLLFFSPRETMKQTNRRRKRQKEWRMEREGRQFWFFRVKDFNEFKVIIEVYNSRANCSIPLHFQLSCFPPPDRTFKSFSLLCNNSLSLLCTHFSSPQQLGACLQSRTWEFVYSHSDEKVGSVER